MPPPKPLLTPHHKPTSRKNSKTSANAARKVIVTPVESWPPPYTFSNNLRRVEPYHFTYNTFCKERWRNRTLLDVFESEFRDRPVEYYRAAIEGGHVQLNGEVTGPDVLVRNGDILSHTLHRHEPPVTAAPVEILYEDADKIVINKPAGVPVHPAGRYNYNSVNQIMRAERGYTWTPMPCNRLDRLTSGVMFYGKTSRAAEDIGALIRDRNVRKEYIARVIGEFPDGEVVCEQPILQISPKLGLNRVRASGRASKTVFWKIAYVPDTTSPVSSADRDAEGLPWRAKSGYSIVRCLPITGRTHQLRVHLQFLGHPIANDPIYANQRVFGANLAAGDAGNLEETHTQPDDDIITRLSRMGKSEVADAVAYHDEMVADFHARKAEKLSGGKCDVCGTELYSDPGGHELGIYLHALCYESEGWRFEAPWPEWAGSRPEGFGDGERAGGGREGLMRVEDKGGAAVDGEVVDGS